MRRQAIVALMTLSMLGSIPMLTGCGDKTTEKEETKSTNPNTGQTKEQKHEVKENANGTKTKTIDETKITPGTHPATRP